MRTNNISLYYIFPIIVNLLLLLLNLFVKNSNVLLIGNISLIEMFIRTIIIPIYLIFVLCINISRFNRSKFILIILISLIVTYFGIAMGYFEWGITTGDLLMPDSETVLIIEYEITISYIILTFGFIIAYFIKDKKDRN